MPVTIIRKIKEINMVVNKKIVKLLLNSKLDVTAHIGNGNAEVKRRLRKMAADQACYAG